MTTSTKWTADGILSSIICSLFIKFFLLPQHTSPPFMYPFSSLYQLIAGILWCKGVGGSWISDFDKAAWDVILSLFLYASFHMNSNHIQYDSHTLAMTCTGLAHPQSRSLRLPHTNTHVKSGNMQDFSINFTIFKLKPSWQVCKMRFPHARLIRSIRYMHENGN